MQVTAVPHLVGRLVRHVVGGAVAGAREAVTDVRGAADERQELMRLQTSPGGLGELTTAECVELLEGRSVGRLAYSARAGVTDIVPVNYVVRDGDVLIRTGPGPKLQAAERGERVAFEIDEIDEDGHSGWSVVVHGTISRATWAEQHRLGEIADPWATGPRSQVIRVRPTRLTGRRLSG